ncbi:hypothetical protein QVD17_06282 [Tagetes erecta]|uniref:Uncharacterized protein n=1 Tax=Tagetes erecta TaxID=13708 RepID=A0AAD8LN57_TARER|nr:hypothetical protein QVD17_06282 [Tagetes erecta]
MVSSHDSGVLTIYINIYIGSFCFITVLNMYLLPLLYTGSQWFKTVLFTYKRLLQQEVEGHTDIKIVSSSSSKSKRHFKDRMSLTWTLPREVKAISFIKEEGMVLNHDNKVRSNDQGLKVVAKD